MTTMDILQPMSGQQGEQGLPLARQLLMIMDVGDEDAAIKEKAHILIEDVIRDAKEHLRDLQEKEREAEYIIQNIQWASCKDFTVERGQQQIEEYMSTLPVEVFFILESNRLIHRPGQCRFREKWLKDIIESKRILMDSITF
ncbi:A-kinase anchor protein 14 isoform X4 [Malaclemys terrapin pileata]|uniref:A-kinase anchor protein 14 isoform X4 n=1 Tax=Malaclemys terrapin pileata TaxID=2991368 RepID=UPI0023A7BD5E|nr:A-kinase anchor protein 14 isoform X4 [Malaclemys terrapin pileata]